MACVLTFFAVFAARAEGDSVLTEYDVAAGSRPHDVAPAAEGGVWYTAQRRGELGYLDPASGKTRHIPLGEKAAPHGVILGPDGQTYFIVYHSWNDSRTARQICMDPLVWTEQGPKAYQPSRGRKQLKLPLRDER